MITILIQFSLIGAFSNAQTQACHDARSCVEEFIYNDGTHKQGFWNGLRTSFKFHARLAVQVRTLLLMDRLISGTHTAECALKAVESDQLGPRYRELTGAEEKVFTASLSQLPEGNSSRESYQRLIGSLDRMTSDVVGVHYVFEADDQLGHTYTRPFVRALTRDGLSDLCGLGGSNALNLKMDLWNEATSLGRAPYLPLRR